MKVLLKLQVLLAHIAIVKLYVREATS